jgi:hypothetical protein
LITNFDEDCDEVSTGWALATVQQKIDIAPISVCQLSNAPIHLIVVLVRIPKVKFNISNKASQAKTTTDSAAGRV